MSKSTAPVFNPSKPLTETQKRIALILQGDTNNPSTWTIK